MTSKPILSCRIKVIHFPTQLNRYKNIPVPGMDGNSISINLALVHYNFHAWTEAHFEAKRAKCRSFGGLDLQEIIIFLSET